MTGSEGDVPLIVSIPYLRHHFFISYARPDKKVVSEIVRKLKYAGIPVWVDEEDIEPGTENWENTIRNAVRDSFAIVLACSPDTAQSQYVQAELQLASRNKRQVFPVWIRGETWVDSVPLSLANCQYIDCRGEKLASGTKSLAERLQNLVGRSLPKIFTADAIDSCPTGFVPIVLPRDDNSLDLSRAGVFAEQLRYERSMPAELQLILANPEMYSSVEELLHDLYSQCLRSRFAPYTYGRDWVLAKPSHHFVSLLALPWEWLYYKRNRQLIDLIPEYVRRSTPFAEYGFGSTGSWGRQSIWAVVDAGFENAHGLFTSLNGVAEHAFDSITKSLSFILNQCAYYTRSPKTSSDVTTGVYPLSNIDATAYRYKLVVVPDRFILVDPANPLSDDSVFIITE